MKQCGRVRSVNVSTEKGKVKTPIGQVMLIKDFGIEGDVHGGMESRQVSLLAYESIQKIEQILGKKLEDGSFAENITTEGVELFTLPIGTKIRIGDTLHELSQIGKKCHTGCEISVKTGQCVMPTEGVFTKVIVAGEIREGDTIEIED